MVVAAPTGTNILTIECLYVSVHFLRRGVGSNQLVYAASIMLHAEHALFVADRNYIAQGLYNSCGWGLLPAPLPEAFADREPSPDNFFYECRRLGNPVLMIADID